MSLRLNNLKLEGRILFKN